MIKQKLQTLKGFRDFLPQKMVIRNEVISRFKSIFQKFGFEELQTPAIEYQKVLLGKYGQEAEKLMYLFKDPGKRDVGLRYDLTVPLARVVATYADLPKPFKRYQIQPVWRAENTQKGRYREFYQCDIDTVGSVSPLADAEIIAITYESLNALGFDSFRIRVNSRQVLFSTMQQAGVKPEKWLTVIQSIDKLDKKSKAEVQDELEKKGLINVQIKNLFKLLDYAKPDKFLSVVIELAKKMGVTDKLIFDSTLARGLDYYTGPIFESVGDTKIGSISGGGRYDELLKNLGGVDLPAVGTTIGLDRVCDVINDLGLWQDKVSISTKVLVTIFSPTLINQSINIAILLRKNNINTELFSDENLGLEKQLKYADKKGIPFVIIIGPQEARIDKVKLKNLRDRTEKLVSLDELIDLVK